MTQLRMEKSNRIRNCVYGQAFGDSLGLSTEFLSQEQVFEYYGNPPVITHENRISDSHRDCFCHFDWTDDTDLSILIVKDIMEHKGLVNEHTLASKFVNWYKHGFEELYDKAGTGIGNTMRIVLMDKGYTSEPIGRAISIAELSDFENAPNGAVMRSAFIGLFPDYMATCDGITKGFYNSTISCLVTHYNVKCVICCYFISFLVHELIYTNAPSITLLELTLIKVKEKYGNCNEAKELELALNTESLDEIKLNESIGYTFKPVKCAIWGLKQCATGKISFTEVIQEIVKRGGDADTNACVAGAVCGTRYYNAHYEELLKENLNNNYVFLDNFIRSILNAS